MGKIEGNTPNFEQMLTRSYLPGYRYLLNQSRERYQELRSKLGVVNTQISQVTQEIKLQKVVYEHTEKISLPQTLKLDFKTQDLEELIRDKKSLFRQLGSERRTLGQMIRQTHDLLNQAYPKNQD